MPGRRDGRQQTVHDRETDRERNRWYHKGLPRTRSPDAAAIRRRSDRRRALPARPSRAGAVGLAAQRRELPRPRGRRRRHGHDRHGVARGHPRRPGPRPGRVLRRARCRGRRRARRRARDRGVRPRPRLRGRRSARDHRSDRRRRGAAGRPARRRGAVAPPARAVRPRLHAARLRRAPRRDARDTSACAGRERAVVARLPQRLHVRDGRRTRRPRARNPAVDQRGPRPLPARTVHGHHGRRPRDRRARALGAARPLRRQRRREPARRRFALLSPGAGRGRALLGRRPALRAGRRRSPR